MSLEYGKWRNRQNSTSEHNCFRDLELGIIQNTKDFYFFRNKNQLFDKISLKFWTEIYKFQILSGYWEVFDWRLSWLKLTAKIKDCEQWIKFNFFIQHNLPQLQYTYFNDSALILYNLCNDFLKTAEYYSLTEIAFQFDKKRFLLTNFLGLLKR